MRKSKAKRDTFWQSQMLPFVIVWTIVVGIIGVLSRFWQSAPLPFLYNEPQLRVALTLITNTIGTGLAQVFLVERLLKKSMRGWMLYTTASLLITLLIDTPVRTFFFLLFQFWNVGYEFSWLLGTLAISAPTSLLQALWLHKRVKHAWLWPLMTIPLLGAFTMIRYGDGDYQLLKLITLLSIGVIQAGLMHYFWQHPKDNEKVKIDFDSDHEANQLEQLERLERLREHEPDVPLWNTGTDQALQNET